MPKGAASLPATRRRSYEANLDWVRYLNRSSARIYKAEHGSWPSQNAPNRKAVNARYEDRRREKRRRARRQRRIDNLPQVLEREQRLSPTALGSDWRCSRYLTAGVETSAASAIRGRLSPAARTLESTVLTKGSGPRRAASVLRGSVMR
jgi:hypothetical protein